MRVAIDGWAPDYGTALPGGEREPSGPVDLTREVATGDWGPRTPAPGTPPCRDVRFIDGVRRIDARVWAIEDEGTRPAIAVSLAAGSVRCNGRAVLEQAVVDRLVVGPAGMPPLEAAGARYRPHATGGSDDDALMVELQRQLGELEKRVAAAADPAELTVVDGPLSGRQNIRGAVGYVKTHHADYLPPSLRHVVEALAPGERTPLFVTQTSWSRFSWYLRLPHGRGHPWAGVVRLEASADLRLDDVVRLADTTAATLPAFASRPHKDPRAPQNLYPISGLEQRLKRRLGDAAYLERALRRAAAAHRPTDGG